MATERQLPPIGEEIHLPGPSAQPLMTAVTFTIALIGVTQPSPVFFIIGATGFVLTLFQWIRDARREFKALPDHHDHGHAEHGHVDHAEAAPADDAPTLTKTESATEH